MVNQYLAKIPGMMNQYYEINRHGLLRILITLLSKQDERLRGGREQYRKRETLERRQQRLGISVGVTRYVIIITFIELE